MSELRYTLISDGSSDQILRHPINWLIQQHSDRTPIAQWADPNIYADSPSNLSGRIVKAIESYPCELLFVHRDAEAQPRENRFLEIQTAISGLSVPPTVCIIPVRMTEAWFLFNEYLLRRAADNPEGTIRIHLPPLKKLEKLPHPKSTLYQLLRKANDSQGRSARKFEPARATHRLAELIDDYAPLRKLKAFRVFERELRETLQRMN